MASRVFPTGRAFQYWVLRFAVLNTLSSVVWVVVYITSVINFDAAQLAAFLQYLTVIVVGGVTSISVATLRITEDTAGYLDASRSGEAPAELARRAFRSVMDLPGTMFAIVLVLWAVFGTALALLMLWAVESFTSFGAVTICIAAFSGGLISQIFSYVWLKQRLSELREELAARIEDAAERAALVRRVPLTAKLYVTVLGLVLVLTAFSLSLAQVRSTERGDSEWVQLGGSVLDSLELAAHEGRDPRSWLEEAAAWIPESSLQLALLDLEDPEAATADVLSPAAGGERPLAVTATELEEILARPEGGSSFDLIARGRFVWRRLPDQRHLALAVSPRGSSQGGVMRTLRDYGALVCFMAGVAVLLVTFVASDLKRAAAVLGEEVQRVASGDLRPGRVFESEDEFGALARSFSGMAASLRGAVGRISEIADHVDDATGQLASSSGAVKSVSLEQVEGIGSATGTMESIHGQAEGISVSARALGDSMNRSSAAITQLGQSGADLSENAATLSYKVDEVSSSIVEMGASITSVGEHAAGLNDSAVIASKSMETMATSVRRVEASAQTAAQLSEEMVTAADRGRDKVQQTIAGIEAIRGATEGAGSVIESLLDQSQQIGTILEVIDGVADETSLLALNAAIIAAQAGAQGRSFKVVADEVKQLARRVLASTKEIAQLIEAVQSESRNAVQAIRQSAERVEKGVSLSAQAGLSLEEITRAAGGTGERVAEIVLGVAEHSRAANEVIELMGKVNDGVEQIQLAGQEQQAASSTVLRSSSVMEEIADMVKHAADEQARGVSQIVADIATVGGSTTRINEALGTQTGDCASAAELLAGLRERTLSNQQSTDRMEEAVQGLARRSEALREDLRRFKL